MGAHISANNFIKITEKPMGMFIVVMKDADTNSNLGEARRTTDLRKAINLANKMMAEEIVEYGLYIDLMKE